MTEESAAPPVERRGLARNAFHLGVGQVLTTALTMIVSAVVARTLGAEDFGLLYLLASISGFAYVFVDWGHGPYITREIARHPRRSGELIGTALVVRVATALLMCLLATSVTWVFGYDSRTRLLTALFVLSMLMPYMALTFTWAFRGNERMEFDAASQVVLKLCNLLLTLAALGLGGRILALIGVNALSGTITFVVGLWLFRRLRLPTLDYSRRTARELIFDGAPMLAISLAIAVQPYIDANLLYSLVPAQVVGWYAAAWGIAGTLVAPAAILGSTMYPRLSRVANDSAEFSRTLRASFKPLLFVAVLGAVGTFQFADFAIAVLYSERKFGPAADILRAFCPALVLIYIDMVFGYSILAVGKATQLAKIKVGAVVVTTLFELVLIRFFQMRFDNGGIGIVLAVAAGELVMVLGAVFMLRRSLAPSMAIDAVRGLAAGAATILLMRVLPVIHPVRGIMVCVALFTAVSAAIGLITRDDVAMLSSILRRDKGAAAEVLG